MIAHMYDRPLQVLGKLWNSWNPAGTEELHITCWDADDVKLWIGKLDSHVEVAAAGEVETWLVYQVTQGANGTTLVILLRVR